MRVVFIGTGEIGLPTLRWLLDAVEHEVVAVVTQPDKPVGRAQALTAPATKQLAIAHRVPVLQPERIRHHADDLKALEPDVAVVVAYGQILSQEVLDVPRFGCLNIHASLLPKFRGASPIQAAILEGESMTGVTIMFMDAGMDTGDILSYSAIPILPEDTGGSLHDRLALLAPSALEEALQLLANGIAPRQPQDDTLATHVGKLKRTDGRMDWRLQARRLERMVRAYNPWPGTHTWISNGTLRRQLKIHGVRAHEEASGCPVAGTVLRSHPEAGLWVACGSGVLELTEVQVEGGRRMQIGEFLRGHSLEVGMILD